MRSHSILLHPSASRLSRWPTHPLSSPTQQKAGQPSINPPSSHRAPSPHAHFLHIKRKKGKSLSGRKAVPTSATPWRHPAASKAQLSQRQCDKPCGLSVLVVTTFPPSVEQSGGIPDSHQLGLFSLKKRRL